MLGENLIAYDCLEVEKNTVKYLTDAVLEAENKNLKQTLLQMRSQAEQDQGEIYQIAEQNGWYLAADRADYQQVSRFSNFFQERFMNAGRPGAGQMQAQMGKSGAGGYQPGTGQSAYQTGSSQYRGQQQPDFNKTY
ncbi:MAG: spore coat protein [Bacillota bacterium]